MDIDSIVSLVLGILGGGAGGGVLGWRMTRKKQAAEVKADEIENMRKAMEDFYGPLVKKQNERIAELESEVKQLRNDRREMEVAYQKQISELQKQIVEITRVLGIKANRQARNERGQFTRLDQDPEEGAEA